MLASFVIFSPLVLFWNLLYNINNKGLKCILRNVKCCMLLTFEYQHFLSAIFSLIQPFYLPWENPVVFSFSLMPISFYFILTLPLVLSNLLCKTILILFLFLPVSYSHQSSLFKSCSYTVFWWLQFPFWNWWMQTWLSSWQGSNVAGLSSEMVILYFPRPCLSLEISYLMPLKGGVCNKAIGKLAPALDFT